MTFLAALIAVLSAAIAACCAAADGALLAGGGAAVTLAASGEGSTLPHGDARDRTHRALSIVRVIMHLVTGISGAIALGLGDGSRVLAPLLALVLALVIVYVSESAPRAYGERSGAATLERLGKFVHVIEQVAAPFSLAGTWLDLRLIKLLPVANPRSIAENPGAEPFRMVFATQTSLPTVQRDILRRYSSLADTEVQEVMVPRVDIVGIERHTPWSEVVDRVRSSQHARLPVYDDTLDQITGILFAKDILLPVIDGAEPADGWETRARPASFIPEGKSAEAQLRDFKSSHNHLAIVVDEYGGTAGLISIEDILEEIVGDIRDENDRDEAPIRVQDDSRFWVSGKVTLDELSEALGHQFTAEDVSTVGGLVFQQFGKVPNAGDSTTIDGFEFTVERVVRRRVDRVFIERPASDEEETAG
jgi:CBS domain containing-hemolysin-like protein